MVAYWHLSASVNVEVRIWIVWIMHAQGSPFHRELKIIHSYWLFSGQSSWAFTLFILSLFFLVIKHPLFTEIMSVEYGELNWHSQLKKNIGFKRDFFLYLYSALFPFLSFFSLLSRFWRFISIRLSISL